MFTKTAVKGRGWTEKLIDTFLPDPDLIKDNPMYRSAPSMLLYKVSRVEEIEQTEEFKQQIEKAKNRKLGAKKAIETKLNKLMKSVDKVKITLPKISKEKLIKRACNQYNNWQLEKSRDYYVENPASENSDEQFLNRICVNFLRHNMTEYEDELNKIFGKVGIWKGYKEIKKKVFEKISEIYPWLREECERQFKGNREEQPDGEQQPQT